MRGLLALFLWTTTHLAAMPSASFSLDTRYFAGQPANEAVATFGLQYHEGLYRLYHWGEPEEPLWRGLYFAGSYLLIQALGLESSWFLSNHEYGHASRADAFQKDRRYVAFDDSRYRDFLPYFVRNLFGRARSGSVTFDSVGLDTTDVFVAFASGVNNSSYFAERIDDQIRGPASSYLYLGPTIQHRLDAFEYANQGGTDIAVVLQYYQGFKGYDIDATDIKVGSLVSLLASNTFWSTAIATGRGIVEGTEAAPPFRVGSVELPNFAFYLTSRGLSLRARTFWHASPLWKVQPAIEAVYRGEAAIEPHLTVQRLVGRWKLEGSLTVSRGTVVGVAAQRQLDSVYFGAAAKVYTGETLEGERLSPDLNAATSAQVSAHVGFVY